MNSSAITFLLIGIVLLIIGWYVIDIFLAVLLYILGFIFMILFILFLTETLSISSNKREKESDIHVKPIPLHLQTIQVKEEPVQVKEEPVQVKEEPVQVKEEPINMSPVPVHVSPVQASPVHMSPVPVHVSPVPVHVSPVQASPVHMSPVPVHVSPVPVHVSPVQASPVPVHVSPVQASPVHVKPVPAHVTEESLQAKEQYTNNVHITKVVPHQEGATVYFNTNGASSYTIVSEPDNIRATGKYSPIEINGLENGKEYTFKIMVANKIMSTVSMPVALEHHPRHAPSNIKAIRGNKKATVSFDHVKGATSYSVISHSDDHDVTVTEGEKSPIIVKELYNNLKYKFTVKAHNKYGCSASSMESNEVFLSGTVHNPNLKTGILDVPNVPKNVSMVKGDKFILIYFSTTGVDNVLTYTANAMPGNHTTTDIGSPLAITGLENGTEYSITLIASNENGDSIPSAPILITPIVKKKIPNIPTSVNAKSLNNSAMVHFTESKDATMYTVTVDPSGIITRGEKSPILVQGLINGTSYTFTVHASNEEGTSIESEPSLPITPIHITLPKVALKAAFEPPDTPTGIIAYGYNSHAVITFKESIGALSYTATSTPGNMTSTSNSETIIIEGLKNGTPYTFTVTATNKFGTCESSKKSNEIIPSI